MTNFSYADYDNDTLTITHTAADVVVQIQDRQGTTSGVIVPTALLKSFFNGEDQVDDDYNPEPVECAIDSITVNLEDFYRQRSVALAEVVRQLSELI